ncbi:MAG: GyrI-like domain-containing protein [Candidatus Aminicenantes bacterium]|nr:GyrI-like domain-containing protein [Candidatus Aminicenantes bacterium]
MKKTLLVFVLVLVMNFALPAEEQKIVIKDMEPFWFAAMECKGSFNQMEQKMGIFMQEFFKQGLAPAGAVLGIYYNDPKQTKEEDLLWAVGFTVAADANVQAPLKKEQTCFKQAAVYLHIGPYQELGKAYDKVLKYIDENGYKIVTATYERYLNDPGSVKPEEIQTEIIVPVEKK